VLGYFSTALAQRVAALEALLAGVTRTTHNGYATMQFSGVNLQLVNGMGTTYSTNGLGNLIIGYDADNVAPVNLQYGSHNLIVGDEHSWLTPGGVLFGYANRINGAGATVTGGAGRVAISARNRSRGVSGSTRPSLGSGL